MAAVFFSYSHKDEALRDELEIHLSQLKRDGLIENWHDRRIPAGSEFDGTISMHLESADVILLLVSPYFIASDYCYGVELARAMEKHHAGEAVVIPVILNPCDWKTAPFAKLLATPTDGRPITKFPNIHEGFLEVAKAVRNAIEGRGRRTAKASAAVPATGSTRVWPDIRSSNLRVRRKFSDHDRDQFREEAFEYMSTFFEQSLLELQKRNPGITTRFRRIDGERFVAFIYRDGYAVSECSVRTGGRHFGDIVFSFDAQSTNSMNESLSIADNGTSMFFKSMGVGTLSGPRDHELSFEGAAEVFWALLMQRLNN